MRHVCLEFIMLPRSKFLILISAGLVSLLIFLLFSARYILLASYTELEEREARSNVERVLNAMSEETASITSLAVDYADWDDSYSFVRDGNEEFIRKNLSVESFHNLGMNLIMYVDTGGKWVFARCYDLEKKVEARVPKSLQSVLVRGNPLVSHPDLKSVRAGILALPEGILLISSVPIQTSDYRGPITGTLLMGRFLNAAEMRRFSEITKLALWVYSRDDARLALAGASLSSNGTALLRKADSETLSAYALRSDVFGKPTVVVRVDTPRTTYRQGEKTIAYFLAWFGGMCILLAVLGDYLVRKVILIHSKGEESDRRYRLLFEYGLDAILVGAPDGSVLEANPEACRLLDRTEDEIRAAGRDGLFNTEDPQFTKAKDAVSASGRFAGELALVRKDGTRVPVEVHTVVFHDSTGLEKTSTVIHDISERKIAEREKVELEERLRQAQKMEAVGQLAGGIAHDFNNILCALTGFASLLEMSLKPDDPARQHAEQILGAIDRATHLVNGLLAFGRKQIINVRTAELNGIVRNIEKILARLITEDIDLRFRLSDASLNVLVDPGQIDQVLLNLAANARDAMPGGGVITVETGLTPLPYRLLNFSGAVPQVNYAFLAVSDTGVGMETSLKERIFEPYFTTKEVGKGTGLGLSIVYGIIKQHNGFITVDSETGAGTVFRIYLPVAEGVTVAEGAIPAPPEDFRGTETLLVAEDDPAVRRLNRTVLETFGYRVIEACDGEDAVRQFTLRRDEIRLLVMDVVMPRMNGMKAYLEIHGICPEVEVLFISGHTADIIQDKGIVQDGFLFLKKPFKPLDLARKVRSILDREGAVAG
ncbi:response regulator [bacterium]|nr:response regulator [bacterium]